MGKFGMSTYQGKFEAMSKEAPLSLQHWTGLKSELIVDWDAVNENSLIFPQREKIESGQQDA